MTIQTLDEESKKVLKNNLEALRANIEKIKAENGVKKDVTLLAATKTVPAEVINYTTKELGITDIGENRVQELMDKYDDLYKENVKIHFIGKLQTNKVKYIVDKVDMIHSVDSVKLAAEIDKQCKKIGKKMDILIEINIGREENKSGIMPEEVSEFIEKMKSFDNITVKGFMTIAPICEKKEDYRKYFAETSSIFIDNLQKNIHNIDIRFLSMGMSGSYESAIIEGTDIIRIGSAIYGSRN